MTRRLSPALLIALAALAVTAGPAAAQRATGTPGAVGDYSFFWTVGDGTTPVTSVVAAPNTTVTVRLWLRETGATGNLLSSTAFGVGAYDTTVAWTPATAGTLTIPTSGAGTAENPNVKLNPYANGGFNSATVFTNDQTVTANTNQSMNMVGRVAALTTPTSYVTNALAPNSAGVLLVNQITFQTGANFTGAEVRGGQRTAGAANWTYGVSADGLTVFTFDDRIGTTTTTLTLTPVPEPASVLLVGAAGMGVVAGVRRWRTRRAAAV